MLLLTPCAIKRRGSNERLAGVRPAVWMRVVGIVIFEIGDQTLLELCGRSEFASLQESTLQNAKPQFDLIQPRTMFRSEMK